MARTPLKDYRCFLDLDGVMADMVGPTLQKFGITEPCDTWDIYKHVGLEHDELFAQLDHDFWLNLPRTPEFDAILQALYDWLEREQVCILTAPVTTASFPHIPAAKYEWIRIHLPEFFQDRFLIGPAKQFCAGPRTLLVDDADKNCAKFEAWGGRAIRIPRTWNKFRPLPTDMYTCVWEQLAAIAEHA